MLGEICSKLDKMSNFLEMVNEVKTGHVDTSGDLNCQYMYIYRWCHLPMLGEGDHCHQVHKYFHTN